MLEEDALLNYETQSRDWRLALFAQLTQWVQEDETNMTFLPLIAHQDRNDQVADKYVFSLAEIMEVKDSDLPAIYMLDPMTHKAIRYPEKLDNVKNFTSWLIVTWANVVKAETDIERHEAELKHYNEEAKEAGLDEEQKAYIKEHQEYLKEAIKHEKDFLKEIKETYEKEKQDIIAHGSEFADNHDEFLEMADLHMERIMEVMMDEL